MKKDFKISRETLLEFVDAAFAADYTRVRRLCGELAALCAEQKDDVTAKQLRSLIRRKGVPLQTSGIQHALPVDGASRLPLIDEEPWPTTPAILNAENSGIIDRFLADVRNAQILADGGLLTRFGLMLSGPPGTGKTLLAGHIAAQLKRPFFIARLDSIISSRLGETAKNIRQIFDFSPARGAVLLLDELDAIAKMRDDRQELGELKRVVNTVIQGLDSLDDQAVVIAATNHPQLLDPAIWRRFPYQCDIGLPTAETRSELWKHFLYGKDDLSSRTATLLSALSEGFSGADIENVALATRRLAVLNHIQLPEPQLLWALANSRSPDIRFPSLDNLKSDQIRSLLEKLHAMDGMNVTQLAKVLRISRQMVHRYLQEVRHE
jgi:DNA polymerase III delta prime subunit